MKKRFLYYFILLLSLNIYSQDFEKDLETIKTENQKCLDTGKFMYSCSVKFYQKSDSLLNVVYKHIRKDINSLEKENLKKEQLIWIKQRDKKFKKITNEDTGLGNGYDDLMVKNHERAKVVNERTRYLISKFIQNNKITISKSEILKFIPENYSILDTVKGNLNRDKFDDYILILKKVNEIETSNYSDNKPEKRHLLILIGNSKGKLELKGKSENSVLCYDCFGAIHGDSYERVVIKNGYFSIEYFTTGGIDRWSRIITFKYDQSSKNWILHKDGWEFFKLNIDDNPNAEAIIKTGEKILTSENFGRVKFEDFNIYN